MPELPEVETMRRGILPIVGSQILGLQQPDHGYRPIRVEPPASFLAQFVTGATIRAIDRLGKRVLIRLSNDLTLVIEPRMTGLVLLADPPNEQHLRLGLRLNHPHHPWLWFWDRRGLGVVHCLSQPEFERRFTTDHLGPDALALTVDVLPARLGTSKRQIKVALLDQRAVAGIGNLYASEILHLAQVHPQVSCERLTLEQWRRIHAATQTVLEDAILHEGSTLSDGTYRNALNQQGNYQNCHRVYDREGEQCRNCSTGKIVRIVQSQRSTFYCPRCQRLPRNRSKVPTTP